MIDIDELPFMEQKNSVSCRRMLCGVLVLVITTGLSACGSKDKKAGQSLVRVNGEEITMLQINDELKRAGVQSGQQEVATRQLLESMIDRQLILTEAMRNKIDRTPDTMQAIERAKAQIIAQAYLQNVASKVAKPSKAEIDDYYQKHPTFFAERKEFDLKQLAIANKNFDDGLKLFLDSAKSLDEVAAWMDKHGVQYVRRQMTRSTADLPQQAVAQLLALPKGQLFIVGEGDSRVLNVLAAIRDNPVLATNAAPQIEQFLTNQKIKEAADVEIAHLRSLAKIEYLAASAPVATVSTPATDTKLAEPK
ncbi:MAG: EpsD family peptidyl-prolyl cis-trans isomerase [Gallionellaceae bacterium]|nr:EpsD family peptidyl-prolyl cis-trans isomerase [Gallionellaceae bacterium]